MIRHIRSALVCLVLVLLSAGMAVPARAAASFGILLAKLEADVALSEAMAAEGERLARERINELRQWVEWWDSVKALAQEKQTDLQKNIDERTKNANLLLATLRGMTTDPKQARNVPNYGWYSVEGATALIGSLALEARQLREAISEGKDTWHIVVLGWITGKAIDDRIAALIAEMDSIDKGITSGEFTFHGAFGWTKILHYRNQAAAQRAELVRIKEVIAKGEYALEIPGLGRLTRKDVERLLSDVDAEIVAIKASAGAGGFQIHRPAVGFVTRDGLTKALDDAETSFRTMQALVSDGLFTVHITGAGGGFLKRQEIEQKIADFDKQIADITTAIRAGDYKAQVLGGWMSRNEIGLYIEDREKRLGDPNLAQIQRNQIAEQIEAAHKALTEWRDLSAVDLVIKTSEKTTYMAWLGWVMKLAKPDFDHRALKRDEMTYHVASFDGELRLRLAPLEARRDALMSARVWFAAD